MKIIYIFVKALAQRGPRSRIILYSDYGFKKLNCNKIHKEERFKVIRFNWNYDDIIILL